MTEAQQDEAYRELQREYLDELPRSLAELRAALVAFRRGEDTLPALKTGLHRLAGSGGSYGFPEISEIARAAEHFVMTGPRPAEAGRLEEAVHRLESVLTLSRARFAAGPDAPDGKRAEKR
jgi:HPt (histidine-containing phosphotransfer) domain-containing protein